MEGCWMARWRTSVAGLTRCLWTPLSQGSCVLGRRRELCSCALAPSQLRPPGPNTQQSGASTFPSERPASPCSGRKGSDSSCGNVTAVVSLVSSAGHLGRLGRLAGLLCPKRREPPLQTLLFAPFSPVWSLPLIQAQPPAHAVGCGPLRRWQCGRRSAWLLPPSSSSPPPQH